MDHCVYQKYEFLSRKHVVHTIQQTKMPALILIDITAIIPSKSRSFISFLVVFNKSFWCMQSAKYFGGKIFARICCYPVTHYRVLQFASQKLKSMSVIQPTTILFSFS